MMKQAAVRSIVSHHQLGRLSLSEYCRRETASRWATYF